MFVSSLAKQPTHVHNAEAQTSPEEKHLSQRQQPAPGTPGSAMADKENEGGKEGRSPSSRRKASPKGGRGRVDHTGTESIVEDLAYSSGFESGSGSGSGGGGGSGSIEEEEGLALGGGGAASGTPGSRPSLFGGRSSGSIPDEAPATGGSKSIRSQKSRRRGGGGHNEDEDIEEEDLATGAGGAGAGAATSGAFGSPTYPPVGGADTSSILDEVKELVETMSKYSSSIDDEVGDVGGGVGGAAAGAGARGNSVAGVEAAASAAGIDTSNLNDQVAAAFLQAVERQMSEEERSLKSQLAAVDAEVQHAVGVRSPQFYNHSLHSSFWSVLYPAPPTSDRVLNVCVCLSRAPLKVVGRE